jgi:Ca2+-binding RTX toxin-like protein
VVGADGDDRLVHTSGPDTYRGGRGLDTLDFSSAKGSVSLDLRTGVGVAGRSSISVHGVERVLGGGGDDTLAGGAGVELFGGGDSDLLIFDIGQSRLEGGAGRDTLDAGAITAPLLVDLGLGAVTVSDQVTAVMGIEMVVAGAGDDTLIGSRASERLDGGAGADVVAAGAGSDTLVVGQGADTLDGGAGTDLLDLSSLQAGAIVDFDLGQVNVAGEVQSFSNVERVRGSDFDDVIFATSAMTGADGGDGLDTLDLQLLSSGFTGGFVGFEIIEGTQYADNLFFGTDLNGRGGDDVLTVTLDGEVRLEGGAGSDRFVFREQVTRDSQAVIVDFEHGLDRIDLSAIDADPGPKGRNQAFAFVGQSGFSGSPGELRYRHDGGDTIVEATLNGQPDAEFTLRLNGHYNLTADDFVL